MGRREAQKQVEERVKEKSRTQLIPWGNKKVGFPREGEGGKYGRKREGEITKWMAEKAQGITLLTNYLP